VVLINATVSGNTADRRGGGIDASDLRTRNSIIAGNGASTSPDVVGAPTSRVASIVGVPAGSTLGEILDPAGLGDHGGPTLTIALSGTADNPALGGGDPAICAAAPIGGIDQRGIVRGSACDIGAYERAP
jgi:hypothetical protein